MKTGCIIVPKAVLDEDSPGNAALGRPRRWQKNMLKLTFFFIIIIIIIINPLTARVVEAPRMILQPVSPFFLVFHCPLGLGELQACLFPDVVFPPLSLSALPSSPCYYALQDGFGQT